MTKPSGSPLIDDTPIAGLPYRYVALGLVCLGLLLDTLDASIISIALPTLATEFDAPVEDVIWVSLIFVLVSTGLGLIMGRLGDLYGRKHLYVLGFLLFTASTTLSSLAGSLPELLSGRVVQAIGASIVVTNGTAIVVAAFPPNQIGRGVGLTLATVGAGVAAGPILGGLLIDWLDWRALFYTRIPLGAVGALLCWRLLRDIPAERRPSGVDIGGSLSLFGLLTTLVLAVNRGSAWGWASTQIVALFVTCALLLGIFVLIERRALSPVVDLALFRTRRYSAGIAAGILHSFGVSAVIVLMPFYLVAGRGFSTLEAGAIFAAMPLAILLISPTTGRLTDRFEARGLATAGLLIVVASLAFLSTLDGETSIEGIVLRLFPVGVGLGVFTTPNMSSVMGAVGSQRLGSGSAALDVARTIGNALGFAVAAALLASAAGGVLGQGDATAVGVIDGIQLAFLVGASVVAVAIIPSFCRGGPSPRDRSGKR